MQSPLPIPRSWTEFFWAAVAIFLASGGAAGWYTAWKNRRKPEAEIHLNEAQTEKAFAEADEIRVRTHATAKELLEETITDLGSALLKVEQLQSKCAAQETELELLRRQMDRTIAPSQRPVA